MSPFYLNFNELPYNVRDEVMAFIKEQKIPVNPVYAKYGLHRTGCMCCTCHRRWREELARVNPKLYRIIMERYFDQKVL